MNQGVRRASLPYVFVLNPDTYLTDSDSIAKLAETLDRDPSIGFVAPKLRGDDGNLAPQGERVAGLAYLLGVKTYANAAWPGNPIARRHSRVGLSRELPGPADTVSAAAVLVRRDEFLAVGGFDERARMYWEEHELAREARTSRAARLVPRRRLPLPPLAKGRDGAGARARDAERCSRRRCGCTTARSTAASAASRSMRSTAFSAS